MNGHVISSVIFRLSLTPLCTSGSHVSYSWHSRSLFLCVFVCVVLGLFVFKSRTVLCLFSMVHLVLACWLLFFFMLSGNARCLWRLAANELWVRQNRNGAFLSQSPAGRVTVPPRARQPLSLQYSVGPDGRGAKTTNNTLFY